MNINADLPLVDVSTFKDVHTEHCCIRHGCKYAFGGQQITGNTCTVVNGSKRQSFACERCDDELVDSGGLELAYLLNEMYDKGFNAASEDINHLHKCGCDSPGRFGCLGS